MSYKVNHADVANYGSIIVEDKTINTDTSLPLVGRFYPGYSKYVAESFLHLLENFASYQAPTNPSIGQLWFNTDSGSSTPEPKLMVWNGTSWVASGSVTKSNTQPAAPIVGDLWVDTTTDNNKLKMYTSSTSGGNKWSTFMTDFDASTGTGIVIKTGSDGLVGGLDQSANDVIIAYIEGTPIAIFSNSNFTPAEEIVGFETIRKGLNVSSVLKMYGTAEKADALVYGNSTKTANDIFIKDVSNETTAKITIKNDTAGLEVRTITNPANVKKIEIKPRTNDTIIVSNKPIVISSNTDATSTNLTLGSSNVTLDKPLVISSNLQAVNITATTKVTTPTAQIAIVNVSNKIEVSNAGKIVPKIGPGETPGTIGDSTSYWSAVYATTVNAATVGGVDSLIQGNLEGTVFGKGVLAIDTTFKAAGDVAVGDTYSSGGIVNLPTALTPTAISGKASVMDYNANDKLLLERNGKLNSITAEKLMQPIGTIILFGGDELDAPGGYVPCDGASLSKQKYSDLYSKIGERFGDDGVTFNVPQLDDVIQELSSSPLVTVAMKYYIFTGVWS